MQVKLFGIALFYRRYHVLLIVYFRRHIIPVSHLRSLKTALGTVLCTAGRLTASLVFTLDASVYLPPPSCENQKCLHTFVPWRAKSLSVGLDPLFRKRLQNVEFFNSIIYFTLKCDLPIKNNVTSSTIKLL